MPRGVLLVVSGPSGSGKTSLCRALHEAGECTHSVSCTTREIREGERDGIDYLFLSPEEFERRIAAGDFLEHAEVHGKHYGTLVASVTGLLKAGTDVVMDIDYQGAAQVRNCPNFEIRESLIDVFILPRSMEELRERLAARGTESEEQMRFRLANAREEMEHAGEYSHRIVSGNRETDYAALLAILEEARSVV